MPARASVRSSARTAIVEMPATKKCRRRSEGMMAVRGMALELARTVSSGEAEPCVRHL